MTEDFEDQGEVLSEDITLTVLYLVDLQIMNKGSISRGFQLLDVIKLQNSRLRSTLCCLLLRKLLVNRLGRKRLIMSMQEAKQKIALGR